MDIVKENKDMISVQYPSILDIIEGDCPSNNPTNRRRFKEVAREHESQMERGWFGPTCKSASEIINKALLGDDILYNKYLKPKMDKLKGGEFNKDYENKIQKVKRRKVKGAIGDELDIHKVYQGQLDTAWTKTERVEVSQSMHMVTILINYAGTAGESAADSLWRVAVALRVVGDLEKAGKSVKVVVGSSSINNFNDFDERYVSTSIVIKEFNRSINLERIAAMSHLGFYRVLGFLSKLSIDKQMSFSMGSTVDINERKMPIHLKEEIEMGHTKFVCIGRADTLHSAQIELSNCYKQLEEFAGKTI